MTEMVPARKTVDVCVACDQLWESHLRLAPDGVVTLSQCVTLLKMAGRGPSSASMQRMRLSFWNLAELVPSVVTVHRCTVCDLPWDDHLMLVPLDPWDSDDDEPDSDDDEPDSDDPGGGPGDGVVLAYCVVLLGRASRGKPGVAGPSGAMGMMGPPGPPGKTAYVPGPGVDPSPGTPVAKAPLTKEPSRGSQVVDRRDRVWLLIDNVWVCVDRSLDWLYWQELQEQHGPLRRFKRL